MKKNIALLFVAVMCLSLVACGGQSEAAKALDEKILTLGEITIESKELLEEIEAEYASLTDKEKKSIENIQVLNDAREKLDTIQAEIDAERQKVQEFAEKLSTIFDTKFLTNGDNVKINNCWYAKDEITGRYYFTYYISTMSGQDYQYWGNDGIGFSDLSDESLEQVLSTVYKNGFYNYSNLIQKSGKTALEMDGIELDAEAIQDYYMRNT